MLFEKEIGLAGILYEASLSTFLISSSFFIVCRFLEENINFSTNTSCLEYVGT